MHSALTPSLPPRRDNVLYMYLFEAWSKFAETPCAMRFDAIPRIRFSMRIPVSGNNLAISGTVRRFKFSSSAQCRYRVLRIGARGI